MSLLNIYVQVFRFVKFYAFLDALVFMILYIYLSPSLLTFWPSVLRDEFFPLGSVEDLSTELCYWLVSDTHCWHAKCRLMVLDRARCGLGQWYACLAHCLWVNEISTSSGVPIIQMKLSTPYLLMVLLLARPPIATLSISSNWLPFDILHLYLLFPMLDLLFSNVASFHLDVRPLSAKDSCD